MGVYYHASIVWGLRIPHTPELDGMDLQDVYELPPGFWYTIGGDQMDGENIAYVVHPNNAKAVVLTTLGANDSFGVYAIGDVYQPTLDEEETLIDFAYQCGLTDDNIDWFAVTSVD